MVIEGLSIGQAAERTGLSEDALRYYEREGLLEHVARNSGGHRRFTERDLLGLHFITRMRSTGMPIRDLRQYMAYMREGDSAREQRMAMLRSHRERVAQQLAEIAATLEVVDLKIAMCDQGIKPTDDDPLNQALAKLLTQ